MFLNGGYLLPPGSNRAARRDIVKDGVMDALFAILVVCLVVAVIVYILVSIVEYIGVGILTLIVSAVGVGGMYLALYLSSVLRIRYLRTSHNLGRIVAVEFDGRDVSWFIDEGLVRSSAKTTVAYLVSLVVGLMCALGATEIMRYNRLFDKFGHPEARASRKLGFLEECRAERLRVSPALAQELTGILSTGVLLCCFLASACKGKNSTYENWTVNMAKSLMIRVERHAKGLKGLQSLESRIHSLAGDMGVTFPISIDQDVHVFCCRHKMEILAHPENLDVYISERSRYAQADLSHLYEAREVHAKAFRVYDETVREVTKAGSIPFVRELEQIYAGLTSPDLQSLVAGRKWTDFLDVVQAIIEDLNRLCGVAVTYQKEGRRGDGREDETLTEEQRAYRILGVPAGVSPEQIKKQYQSLAQLWHPDKGMVRDDQRMKEINWAYEFLKDLRRF